MGSNNVHHSRLNAESAAADEDTCNSKVESLGYMLYFMV